VEASERGECGWRRVREESMGGEEGERRRRRKRNAYRDTEIHW